MKHKSRPPVVAVTGLHRGENPQPGPAVTASLRRRFPDHVYDPIPRSVRFRDSALAGMPLLAYDSSHAGAAAYRALARKVL